jgi:hypothetical protein
MATQHEYRFLAIVPAASIAQFNTWLRNNIDPAGGDWLVANLSATGLAPATHGWFSAALTPAQMKQVALRLCTLASVTPPADWDTMTRAQRKAWLIGARAAINTAIGVWIQPSDNDGDWDNPAAALAAKGLQVIAPV